MHSAATAAAAGLPAPPRPGRGAARAGAPARGPLACAPSVRHGGTAPAAAASRRRTLHRLPLLAVSTLAGRDPSPPRSRGAAGPAPARGAGRCRPRLLAPCRAASVAVFSSDDIVIEATLGAATFLEQRKARAAGADDGDAAAAPGSGPAGSGAFNLTPGQATELVPGRVTVKLYAGVVVAKGPFANARVLLKAYPNNVPEADVMIANELKAHLALQPPSVPDAAACPRMAKLLGGFVSRSAAGGEQWLVLRNDGTTTAEKYASEAAVATARAGAVGPGDVWDSLDPQRPLARRGAFVKEILAQALEGLAFMHARRRLHQSLGPASLILSGTDERDAATLAVRLQDLAFSVDVSDEALVGGATLGEIWEGRRRVDGEPDPMASLADGLWVRARAADARTAEQRRRFGVSDDIYSAGLMLAYLAFVPFCPPGSIDMATLQRLLEGPYAQADEPEEAAPDGAAGAPAEGAAAGALDADDAPPAAGFGRSAAAMEPFREYAAADDRWAAAVAFLDNGGDRAGWALLGAALCTDWRRRPTAESMAAHPFLAGTPGRRGRPSLF